TIGNSDNYATLWALALPLSVGITAIYRVWWPFAVSSAIIGYAGLLLYSRASLLVGVLSLLALVVAVLVRGRYRLWRVVAPSVAIVLLLAVVLSPAALAYIGDGVASYGRGVGAGHPTIIYQAGDASGAERAEALRRGVDAALHHPITGIGFGMYPKFDPVLTSPHSQLLLWFSEGGILGLVSILALCSFTGIALFASLRGRPRAPAIVASVAA